jgi:hypothetical protein
MRLLFGRPVPTEGRQPETLTAPAVHLPTLSVSQTDHLDGDQTRVPRSPTRAGIGELIGECGNLSALKAA